MSRRSRRSWGKRALTSEKKARIQKVVELANAGFEPAVIASASKLPEPLVVAMLEMKLPREGGGDTT